MSNGHEEFEKLIHDLRKAGVGSVPALMVHFDERLTRLEDAMNEILDEEEL